MRAILDLGVSGRCVNFCIYISLNSLNTDQTQRSAASEQGLHCLRDTQPLKGASALKRENGYGHCPLFCDFSLSGRYLNDALGEYNLRTTGTGLIA